MNQHRSDPRSGDSSVFETKHLEAQSFRKNTLNEAGTQKEPVLKHMLCKTQCTLFPQRITRKRLHLVCNMI